MSSDKQVSSLFHAIGRRLWLSPLLPRRLGRILFKRLSRYPQADYPFSTEFFGLHYRGNLNNNIDYSVYYYGAFEKPLLFFLSDTLQAIKPAGRGTFIDIGANVGQHSLYMSRFAAQVHALEPYAPVRRKLLAQAEENAIGNIAVHPVGLSDVNSRQAFYAPTGNNAGIGSFDAATVAKGNQKIGELELRRGDDYFAELGVEEISLMKIDVEGFEKPAIRGMQNSLRRHRPVIVCELSYGQELSFRSTEELLSLLPENYRLFTFNKRKADGSKARRRDGRARLSGQYEIVPYSTMPARGQDDVIACPAEYSDLLPRSRSPR